MNDHVKLIGHNQAMVIIIRNDFNNCWTINSFTLILSMIGWKKHTVYDSRTADL